MTKLTNSQIEDITSINRNCSNTPTKFGRINEMNKQKIKELALANGFKLKQQTDGTEDLNPYVYDFAAALAVDAGRGGFIAGFIYALGDADEIDKEFANKHANQYHASILAGKE